MKFVERRSAYRKRVDKTVSARIPASYTEVKVLDLSQKGCQLETAHRDVQVGRTIVLRLPESSGAETVGMVVWVEDNKVGVVFTSNRSSGQKRRTPHNVERFL